ncbi:TonB-dependent receptor [Algoriphagus taiwanensis]|uniref:TonB-dependent receptor n=1 Tax=Algoriphagus taiwanensis TaxID=1445656 RepID=A0ABQ6PZX9_9BACT|nr:TonB-dependent receptor [Algoriphagus taiwanensis]
MKIRPLIVLFGGALLGISSLQAQNQQRGEVQDQEFVIRKDRVLTVPTQPRSFERLPVLPQSKGMQDFVYTLTPYFLTIPALQVQPTAVQKNYRKPALDLYPGFLRAGYGNFASPLLEARYMSTTADPINFAVAFKHQSFGKGPIEKFGEGSPESHTLFGGDVSYFLESAEVFGSMKWGQDKYSFYGTDLSQYEDPLFDPSESLIKNNVQNHFQVAAGVREIEKIGPFGYEAQVSFRTFKDSYLARENEIGISAVGKFNPSEDWSGTIGLDYFSTNPEDSTYQVNRNYFAIRPRVNYSYADFRFTAGLNIVSENDSVPNKSSDFRIFPVLKASYQFAEEFGFYGEFSGDVQRNTYFSFVQENPFLGPSEQLLNTVNNYKIAAGIEGQFQGVFHYRAGIDVSRYNQLHFFANSQSDTARFELVYDEKSTVANLNAELGFKFSDTYTLGTRLDLFQYDLSIQQEAWHRPIWTFSVNNQIKPIEKLLIQANLNFMGGIKARGDATLLTIFPPEYEVVSLKTIADLQLKADFKITDRISVFAEGNNLTNGKNMRWLNYPVRGVQLIGGASLKF